tara:strand:- start:5094 stop:8585 length:3492 start_codon:yes stop_codon:yes gene_type:complete
MSDTSYISDFAERKRALDPTCSFIVQAPAGSGKTGLLIQRYLKLLVYVGEPEEIVVITFTKKAVAEIKKGVLAALTQSNESSENEHVKLTRKLASAVLRRDYHSGWNIVKNPARLRIQTIDSLCASLVRQMPILSKSSSQMKSTEDAFDLYREAARATISLVTRDNFSREKDNVVAQDVAQLLKYLNNDVSHVEKLLVKILEKRDQWLPLIYEGKDTGENREKLEAGLRNARCEVLKRLSSIYPEPMCNELLELLRYAASNLKKSYRNSPISICEDLFSMPGYEEYDVDYWKGIAQLLTTEKDWRKRLTKLEGFPSGNTNSEKKKLKLWVQRAYTLINSLKKDDTLRKYLHKIKELPPPVYTENQWKVLNSIIRLLRYTVGHLKLVFKAHGRVDYIEVMLGALQALGDPDAPTDLALALDYRIQHLLMDEFQDTSKSQFDLITKLTAGWGVGDGRTLFVVGDPMQSIYRFREAEVSLFSRARTEGIGNIELESIVLRTNFRSHSGIVDWVNSTFSQIMSERESLSGGGVPYTDSVSIHKGLSGPAVQIHPFFNGDHKAESKKVVEIIRDVRRDDPSATMAILGRTHKALYDEIIPQLRKVGLSFRADGIEEFSCQPVVQDLLVLTRALLHLADKLAWLAVLRAPWCGLKLADLYVLFPAQTTSSVGMDDLRENKLSKNHQTVWEALNDDTRLLAVSTDGAMRLRRIRKVLGNCINNNSRQSLRADVEAAWLALGGAACVGKEYELEAAEIYFDYLENHEKMGNIYDLEAFEEGLLGFSTQSDIGADDTLQLMTIHKSKGLEFDYVIVPGLGRSSGSNKRKLIQWCEHPDLLLAPIQEAGLTSNDHTRPKENSIYRWLEKLEQEKDSFEDERILYVAATRARNFLHILGNTALLYNSNGVIELKKPSVKSLLRRLWPVAQPIFSEAATEEKLLIGIGAGEDKQKYIIDQSLRRLTSDWVFPSAPTNVKWSSFKERVCVQEIEFSWAGETARYIGMVVHRWLKNIAEDAIDKWNKDRIDNLHNIFKQNLIACGMSDNDDEIEFAITKIKSALIHTIKDERGQWLLGPQKNAQNELSMTTVIDGNSVGLIIDRTFIGEDGLRWIVDYKTSSHVGSDIEFFLDRERERYRSQLNCYADMISRIDNRPIKLGLYFPLLNGWREWGYEG